ncbi:hypothetical protein CY35_15G007300 [Sphagnum magellanicum]|nr:hypothetical protein CY35_15G007300 [Sphagnum magellanicum]
MQLVLNDPAHDLSVSNQSSDQFMAVLVCGAHDCKLDCVDPGEGKRASCSSSATALRDEEGSCCSGHTAYSTSPTTWHRISFKSKGDGRKGKGEADSAQHEWLSPMNLVCKPLCNDEALVSG